MSASDYFNVFEVEYEAMTTVTFGDARVEGRVLYRAADDRKLVIATRYPEGVRFTYGGSADYEEIFYVVAGHGSRSSGTGQTVEMNPGDLIYVHPGVELAYVYEPGFVDVAFFWSERRLDPELSGGIVKAHVVS
jgi:mannose-6-phosphate isomerase-like protein (cupin superfamily)